MLFYVFESMHTPKLELVKWCLRNGADLKARDSDGLTALMYAVQYGELSCAMLLHVRTCDDVDAVDNQGYTALMHCAKNKLDIQSNILEFLIRMKADVENRSIVGMTALMISCKNGHEQVARALIEAKANIEATEEDGWTALMFSCRGGHEQVALALIKAKANLEATQNQGFTALMLAAQSDQEQVARVLIEAGADANVTAVDPSAGPGWTALMYASQNGHDLCLLELLKAGARKDLMNNYGETALDIAKRKKHPTIVNILEGK